MILHFLEVWLLLGTVFAGGCVLGTMVHSTLGRGQFAAAQALVADTVGDMIDEIKYRLGVGPEWRPATRSRNGHASERDDDDWSSAVTDAGASLENGTTDEGQRALAAPDERIALPHPDAFDEPVPEEIAPAPLDETSMMRPATLPAPRTGVPDNLQRIRGIGRRNEQILHELGIFHFGQIAAWTPAEMRWVAAHFTFPERVERDDWVGQAIILASGGATGFHEATERKMRALHKDEDEA